MLYQLSLCIVTTALSVACKGRAGVWKLDLQHSASKVIATSISRPDFFIGISSYLLEKVVHCPPFVCESWTDQGIRNQYEIVVAHICSRGDSRWRTFQVPSRNTVFLVKKSFLHASNQLSTCGFGNSQAIADFQAKVRATEAEVADHADKGLVRDNSLHNENTFWSDIVLYWS